MASEPTGVTLTPEQLNETDRRILDELQQGRVTPQYLSEQLDLSRPYASERIKRFVEHGHVEKIASGLYQLAGDPREGTDEGHS